MVARHKIDQLQELTANMDPQYAGEAPALSRIHRTVVTNTWSGALENELRDTKCKLEELQGFRDIQSLQVHGSLFCVSSLVCVMGLHCEVVCSGPGFWSDGVSAKGD